MRWTRRAKPDGSGFLRFPTHVVLSSYSPDASGKLILNDRHTVEVDPLSLRIGSEIDEELLLPPPVSESDRGAPVIDGSVQQAPAAGVRTRRAEDAPSLSDELRIKYLAWIVTGLGAITLAVAIAMTLRNRSRAP